MLTLRSELGVAPFMVAGRYGYTTCFRMLLGDSRLKVNETGGDGPTPLVVAASEGHLDVIRWWIASGREMDLGTPGNEEMDAIGEAKKEGKTEVVALLERFKGDATRTRSEVRMELGITGQSPFSPFIFSFRPYGILNSFFQFRFPSDHPTQAHARGVRRLS